MWQPICLLVKRLIDQFLVLKIIDEADLNKSGKIDFSGKFFFMILIF